MSSLSSSSVDLKLARDDDQILALNYENLCDKEYLNKLIGVTLNKFFLDKKKIADDFILNDESDILHDKYSWINMPELPESITLFSDNMKLGSDAIILRTLREIINSLSSQSPNSSFIDKQIIVFDKIGASILKKISSIKLENSQNFTMPDNLIQNSSSMSSQNHIVSNSLLSTLDIFNSFCITNISLQDLEPILYFVSRLPFEQPSEESSELRSKHNKIILCLLRNIIYCSLNIKAKENKNLRESYAWLKLAMRAIYSVLNIGLNSKDFNYILSSISHIVSIQILVKELQKEFDNLSSGEKVSQNSIGKFPLKAKLLINQSDKNSKYGNEIGDSLEYIERDNSNLMRDKIISKSWDKTSDKKEFIKDSSKKYKLLKLPNSGNESDNNNNNNNNNSNSSSSSSSSSNNPLKINKPNHSDSLSLSEKVAIKASAGTGSMSSAGDHPYEPKNPSCLLEPLSTVPKSILQLIKKTFSKSSFKFKDYKKKSLSKSTVHTEVDLTVIRL